jgi:hypothetical protein
MKQFIHFICGILFCVFLQASELVVYENVPGLSPSDQYRFRVKELRSDTWKVPFAHKTDSKAETPSNAYFNHLKDWTHTYINFEMQAPVLIEISRCNGEPIKKAAVHPKRSINSIKIIEGKVLIKLNQAALFAVDIDGQMDEQHTGMGYDGPPIHSLSVFANPVIQGKPSLNDKQVYYVKPGEEVSPKGDWKTLYFLPGIHDIGLGFELHPEKQYYIPGDAIVYGTFYNYGKWAKGHDIKLFGCGTLSGLKLKNPSLITPKPVKFEKYHPIHIDGARNVLVEGITLEDPAYHSVMLINEPKPDQPSKVKWLKILGWRKNGDGINPFGNVMIEDCFIRTQDDGCYANGLGIKRTTFWHDANGSAFVLSALPNRKLIVEDCDVIYIRAEWHNWSGGRVFNIRGEGEGKMGHNVVFRDIRVTDPFPTLQHFFLCMRVDPPYDDSGGERVRKPGAFNGTVFENISISNASVQGLNDILWGTQAAEIENITFRNVQIEGEKIDNLKHFEVNSHVSDIKFE